ncbi:MAG: fasciclin domain-containing protein [Dysgonamonadaceae bacterium]|nr:fasciclin domain-containing protein [Dysgonamonadaceae bacterium]
MKKTFFAVLYSFTITGAFFLFSCEDEYIYDDTEPDFLGASIYEELEKDGRFTYFLRLIDELNYKEVLLYTGSKTLFPARDDAFERFFRSNSYGVGKFEELTPAQKREIMNVSMINMAYSTYMLSNTLSGDAENPGLSEGMAIRRVTANTYIDSVGFINDDKLFQANAYWAGYRDRGLYLLENEQSSRMVHFTPNNRATQGITNEDFSFLYNGLTFNSDDIYINGVKVIEKDIICKNGYIHLVEEVLTPVKNMAQIIRDNGETHIFNSLINKFTMPVYSEEFSRNVHNYYNGSTPERPLIVDTVFIKRYFNDVDFNIDPTGNTLSNYGLLYYDPTDHAYNASSNQDMGAMFIPTDKAMNDYFNSEKGRYLKDIYGTWDNVPTDLLALFLKNHQKKSFLSSLPHEWTTMNDESSFYMNVKESDIRKVYVGGNGVVYISDAVYPPVDFQSVFASVMTTPNTKIMNWGIRHNNMKFFMYLRSIENMYNLIVPTDEAFDNYRDPISWARGTNPEIWSFYYVPETDMVYAQIYRADENGNKGTFLKELRNNDQSIILNRLNDIIDMHIAVGQKDKATGVMSGYIDDGNTRYARTKSGATLQINGAGDRLQLSGGGDIEAGVAPAEIITHPDSGNKSTFLSENGKTYFVDKILHDPVKSVYTLMGEHPEYEAFFNLLLGETEVFDYFKDEKSIVPIFDAKKIGSTSGIDLVVNSFNNFRYTVFIPTAEALAEAFNNDPKLYTWAEIADETDYDRKKEMTLYLLEFLRFHFMDNSVFIDGKSFSVSYETAARNELGKFRKVRINSRGDNLEIYGETMPPSAGAQVIKTEGLYNLMARDYIVNNSNYANATQIVSSSRAVIHLIDKALKYE